MRTDVTVEEWIRALESGAYRKAKGRLRSRVHGELHHCCLGVLCDIAGTRWDESHHDLDVASSATIHDPSLFGPEIAIALTTPGFTPGSLASLNDDDEGDRSYAAVIKALLRYQEEVRCEAT